MAKKRKSEATRLDEVDRSMYTSFCSAANSLSQLYTQSMNQQRLSFQAGERHGLDKLYQWIFRQQEEGSRVNAADIVSYLQNELEYGIDESPMSPRVPFQSQQQSSQTAAVFPVSSPSFGPTATLGQTPRSGHSDHHQTKNSVFSNALSSPVRRSLQQYHLSQGGSYPPPPHNRDNNNNNNPSSNDSAMDMHSDSPGRDSS